MELLTTERSDPLCISFGLILNSKTSSIAKFGSTFVKMPESAATAVTQDISAITGYKAVAICAMQASGSYDGYFKIYDWRISAADQKIVVSWSAGATSSAGIIITCLYLKEPLI